MTSSLDCYEQLDLLSYTAEQVDYSQKQIKQCAHCKETKSVTDFYGSPGRLHSYCKPCHRYLGDVRKSKKVKVKKTRRKPIREKKQKRIVNQSQFGFVSPTGQVYRGTNLKKFCGKHNLNYYSMIALKNGRQLNHKGWIVYSGAHVGPVSHFTVKVDRNPKLITELATNEIVKKRIRDFSSAARKLASKYSYDCRHLTDDMTQELLLVLVQSAYKCLSTDDLSFKAYAWKSMRGRAIKFLKENKGEETFIYLDAFSPHIQEQILLNQCV